MRYEEFKSDAMMHALHEKQATYSATVQDMTPEEELEFFRAELRKKLSRDGWQLVCEQPGILRLRKARRARGHSQVREEDRWRQAYGAHGNLHEFFENLRPAQRKYSDRPVSAPPPRPGIREAVGKYNSHGEPSVSCELTEA